MLRTFCEKAPTSNLSQEKKAALVAQKEMEKVEKKGKSAKQKKNETVKRKPAAASKASCAHAC